MNKMTPLEKDLNDLLNDKILKTRMYSFEKTRELIKLDRKNWFKRNWLNIFASLLLICSALTFFVMIRIIYYGGIL